MWSNTSWAAYRGPAIFRTAFGTWNRSVSEIIVDTGPLVALLVKTDDHHAWMVDRLRELRPPFLTCEAVLAEVAHLARRVRNGAEGFVDLLLSDLLRVEFDLMTERGAVGRLLRKYADRPMALADVCLVAQSPSKARSRRTARDQHQGHMVVRIACGDKHLLANVSTWHNPRSRYGWMADSNEPSMRRAARRG